MCTYTNSFRAFPRTIDGLCICDEASDVLVLPQALVAAFKYKGKVGMFRWQLYQEAKLIF